jgi:hypothetical protein
MGKENLPTKCIVLGIILLFIGTAFPFSLSKNETRVESIEQNNSLTNSIILDTQQKIDQPADQLIQRNVRIDNETEWIPFIPGSEPGTPPTVKLKCSDNSGIFIDSDIPGMYSLNVAHDNETYQALTVPHEGQTADIGEPQVPIIQRFLEIPYDVNLTVSIFYSNYTEWEDYTVLPAQEPEPNNQITETNTTTRQEFTLDKNVYTTDQWYPSYNATVDEPVIMRGHRIVALTLCPVQWNPATHRLRGYSKIEVWVNYDHPAQIESINETLVSVPFENLTQALVLNYKPPKNGQTGGETTFGKSTGADYLIITSNSFYNQIKPLADWKQRKGYRTTIINTSSIPGGPNATNIRNYIRYAYMTWDPKPTYLLLVGDANSIPPSYKTVHPYSGQPGGYPTNTYTATDLYYAAVDGNDYFPDIFIGRLSVDDATQAATVVNKILGYERNPPTDPTFYSKAAVISYFQDDDDPSTPNYNERDGYEDRTFTLTSEMIRTYLLTQGYNVYRIYNASQYVTPRYYDQYWSTTWGMGTALPPELLKPGFRWDGNTANIATNITAGRFLINFEDHGGSRNSPLSYPGYPEGWDIPWYTTTEINQLANGNKLPVVFSMCCESGWFDGDTDQFPAVNYECFCEGFTRYQNGGAVAAIGSTRVSYDGYDDYLNMGFVDALWPNFNRSMQTGPIYELGAVLTYGKVYLARFGAATLQYPDIYRKTEFEEYHLFGDPEMSLWTSTPRSLSVSGPSTIGSGGPQKFVVVVKDGTTPVSHALVCLSKQGDVYTFTYTDAGGNALFNITPSTYGTISVTVTKHNYLPSEGSIMVSINGATISLSPTIGAPSTLFTITGNSFSGSETVNIYFSGYFIGSVTANNGGFSGDFTVPQIGQNNTVNVIAIGYSSGRYAVAVFTVISAQSRPDPYMYDQWDPSTWRLNPSGFNPAWDNPTIQLYDAATGRAVSSNNLTVGTTYRVTATIYNQGTSAATNTNITFSWAYIGIGQAHWPVIGYATITVPLSGSAVAQALWTPIEACHCCILVEIYNNLDMNPKNNKGQENCDVKNMASPVMFTFNITNPTNTTGLVYLELVQDTGGRGDLWHTRIERAFPQTLRPGETKPATVTINPPDGVSNGDSCTVHVTGFIDGYQIGGIDFTAVKDDPPFLPSNPNPSNDSTDVPINPVFTFSSGDLNTGNTVTYDVYFGTNPEPPYLFTLGPYDATQTWIMFNPGMLEYQTTYYWYIVAYDNYGFLTRGPVWHCTTEQPEIDPDQSYVTLTNENMPLLVTCPLFDGPPYHYVKVKCLYTNGEPFAGIPASAFAFTINPTEGTHWHGSLSIAFTPVEQQTNANGEIHFEVRGYTSIVGNITIQATVQGVPLNDIDTLPCKSPDYNTDGTVSLTDFVTFAQDYGTTHWRSDFTGDGTVSLSDFVMFAQHYGHHW